MAVTPEGAQVSLFNRLERWAEGQGVKMGTAVHLWLTNQRRALLRELGHVAPWGPAVGGVVVKEKAHAED